MHHEAVLCALSLVDTHLPVAVLFEKNGLKDLLVKEINDADEVILVLNILLFDGFDEAIEALDGCFVRY